MSDFRSWVKRMAAQEVSASGLTKMVVSRSSAGVIVLTGSNDDGASFTIDLPAETAAEVAHAIHILMRTETP